MTATPRRPRLEPLVTAVGFLTRLPVPHRDGAPIIASLPWFPVVGALVGAVVGAVAAVAGPAVNPLTGAALGVAVGALVTGGFHEDGLGDTADGFGGGWDRDQRLAIMDDPRQGTYGVLAITLGVLVRVAALSALSGWAAVSGAAAVHLLARAWSVLVLTWAPSARDDGLARSARPSRSGSPRLVVAVAASIAATVVLAGPVAVAGAGAAGILAAGAVTLLVRRKIGGVTGDVLGAVEQGAEVLGLVAMAALARHAPPGPGPWWP